MNVARSVTYKKNIMFDDQKQTKKPILVELKQRYPTMSSFLVIKYTTTVITYNFHYIWLNMSDPHGHYRASSFLWNL